jgi:hypothetical protein
MTISMSPSLHRLSQEIAVLSLTEKLWLLAQIALQVQPDFSIDNLATNTCSEVELRAMANGPEIQQEMTAINWQK